MAKDRIDASIGLAFSLMVFERYQRHGVLQAELHHIPRKRGRWKGVLFLVEGKVVECYVEDGQGLRHRMSKESFVQLDREKGPFEWELLPLPEPPSQFPPAVLPMRFVHNAPVPQRVAKLELERVSAWTARQKSLLLLVYEAVDGRRSIEDICDVTPLPEAVVEEVLRVLISMHVVIIP